jgi:hypothetical protein
MDAAAETGRQAARKSLDFIVCGMPRGGTTFFGQLFNTHPDVYCYFMETSFFRQLHIFGRERPFPPENLPALEGCLRSEFTAALVHGTREERTSTFRRLTHYKNVLGQHGLAEATGPGIRVWDETSVEELIAEVLDLFRRGLYGTALFSEGAAVLGSHLRGVTRRTRIGEKTPDNLFYVRSLQEALPDLKAFCILREPYSTLESMKRRALRSESFDSAFSREVWRGIVEYYRFMRAAFDLSQSSSDESFSVCRFEDLLDDPVREMQKVFRTLGLVPPDDLHGLLPHLRAPTDIRHTHELVLSPAENRLIDMVLGPMLRHFGYDDVLHGSGLLGDVDLDECVLPLAGVHADGGLGEFIQHGWMSAQADLFLLYRPHRSHLRLTLACDFPKALGLETVSLTFNSGGKVIARVETLPEQQDIQVDIALADLEQLAAGANLHGSHLRISSSDSYTPITIAGLGPDIRNFSFLIVASEFV